MTRASRIVVQPDAESDLQRLIVPPGIQRKLPAWSPQGGVGLLKAIAGPIRVRKLEPFDHGATPAGACQQPIHERSEKTVGPFRLRVTSQAACAGAEGQQEADPRVDFRHGAAHGSPAVERLLAIDGKLLYRP